MQSRTQLPPLSAEQARAFDNGVDYIASLEGIEGRWRDDWERDLTLRVATSNRVALVTVRTLRTDTDPQQRVTYRLVATVDKDLVGEGAKELALTVPADVPGFGTIEDNLTRIPDKQYVVYLRAAPDVDRFHLSAASEPVVLETRRKITDLGRDPNKTAGERVIVHTN
ncbi:MAG: hypothetical protein ABW252_01775 [Polyangiales bacterium]